VLTIFHATHLVVEALADRRELAVDDAEVAVELDGNISVCTVSHCDALNFLTFGGTKMLKRFTKKIFSH
jgi:hypothetical protein